MKTGISISILVLAFVISGKCQFNNDAISTLHVIDSKDGDTTGFFVTVKNDTIFMIGNADLDKDELGYHLSKQAILKGKWEYKKFREIKFMFFGTGFWLTLPAKKGAAFRLMQINAMTNKYLLATDRTNMVYVYDLEGNPLEKKMWVWDDVAYPQWKKSNEKVLLKLKPYFSECEKVWEKLNFNLTYNRYLIDDLLAVRCGTAAPDIKELTRIISFR
jgi:hypothetical protein